MNQELVTMSHVSRRAKRSVLPGALTKGQLRENLKAAIAEAGYTSTSDATRALQTHLGHGFDFKYSKSLLSNIISVRRMPGFDRIDAIAWILGLPMDTIRGLGGERDMAPTEPLTEYHAEEVAVELANMANDWRQQVVFNWFQGQNPMPYEAIVAYVRAFIDRLEAICTDLNQKKIDPKNPPPPYRDVEPTRTESPC